MKYPILSYISHHRQFYSMAYEDIASELKLTQLEIDILLFLINNPEFNTARISSICAALPNPTYPPPSRHFKKKSTFRSWLTRTTGGSGGWFYVGRNRWYLTGSSCFKKILLPGC